jgi:hypothetical protein
VTSDRVWQRALVSVSKVASLLTATFGILGPRCPYNPFVYIKTSCSSKKMLLIFIAIFYVNNLPIKTNKFYS